MTLDLDALRAEHQYPAYATAADEAHRQNPECSCGRNPCVVPALLDEIDWLNTHLQANDTHVATILEGWRADEARADDLVFENAELREQMSTMHRSVVHECCVAVQQVTELCNAATGPTHTWSGMPLREGALTVSEVRRALEVKP